MDEYTACEQAYKNGYEKGYADGKTDGVVHGRFDWNYRLGSGRKEAVCTKCKNDPYWYHHYLKGDEHYCPNCGARMEGGAEDG